MVSMSLGRGGKRELPAPNAELRYAGFLSKPVKPSQLYELIVEVLAGRGKTVKRSMAKPKPERRESSLRVLLAEDNVVNQRVALRSLERLGYSADVAANGKEVLDHASRQSYDVILMDVHMPEMDGLEATRRIREQLGGQQGPWIIAMTASAMQGDREECIAAGMDDYISKPASLANLRAALERSEARTGLRDGLSAQEARDEISCRIPAKISDEEEAGAIH